MEQVEALPQLVDPTDFNLNNKTSNSKFLLDLRKKPSKKKVGSLKLRNKQMVPIWQSGGLNDKGYFWIEFQDHLVWLVKFELLRRTWLPKQSTTQVALWRGGSVLLPRATSSKLFFTIVFKRTGCMLSDRLQTEEGKRFWLDRMGDAIEDGLHVGLADFDNQTVTEVSTVDEINDLANISWGLEPKFRNKRWMIWK